MLPYAIPTNAKAQKQYAKVGTAHAAGTLAVIEKKDYGNKEN